MKKIINLKLILYAGKATPNPPVGPMLGQYGINIAFFCNEYNKKTQNYIGLKIPVSIIFSDPKKINLKLHIPSTAYLVSTYKVNNIISLINLQKILNIKKKEFYPISTKKCLDMIKGTLKSMNVKVKK